MYLDFYGLREEPFGVTPDPRFLYLSPSYREAQATLEYGLRSGRGFTALVAPPGMGKTTLLFHLLERYSGVARTAFLFLTQCDSREFLRYLMSEMGADTGESDFVRLQEQFGELLVREAQAGKQVIAVVDEAQNLDVSVLETARLLSDFETTRAKLLHIILSGQPKLGEKLGSPALLQLRQRISHLVRLRPLSGAEIRHYIEHRLRVAGYSGPPLFTREARAVILERSQGIPRLINNLCFHALSLGCALNKKTVDGRMVAEACADLDFESLSRPQQEQAAAAQAGATPVPRQPAAQEGNGITPVVGPVLVSSPPALEAAAAPQIALESGSAGAEAVPLAEAGGAESSAPGAAEAKQVDVEALASDCALLEMEAPQRWKRPAQMPGPGSLVAAAAGPPVKRQQAVRRPAANAKEGEPAPATKVITLVPTGQPPQRRAADSAAGRLQGAATVKRRDRQRRLNLYLAAAASALLLLLIAWLLRSNGRPVVSQPAAGAAPAASITVQPTAPTAAGVDASDSTVLDVVEELPPAGAALRRGRTQPAVIVRGTGRGGQLLHRVDPEYPPAALASRTQGTVVVQASIGAHGFLRHIQVLSGPPILADAVLDAVQGWQYEARRSRRGQAAEAVTRIVVNFRLTAANSSAQP